MIAFDREDYQSALHEQQLCYQTKKDPRFLANIGHMHLKLHHCKEALDAYAEYEKQQQTPHPDSSIDATVKAGEEEAKRQCEQEEQAALQQSASPPPGPAVPKPVEPTQPKMVSVAFVKSAQAPRLPVPVALRYSKVPFYKRWWFWTTLGVALTGVAVGVGVGLGSTDLPPGTIDIFGDMHSSQAALIRWHAGRN